MDFLEKSRKKSIFHDFDLYSGNLSFGKFWVVYAYKMLFKLPKVHVKNTGVKKSSKKKSLKSVPFFMLLFTLICSSSL